jgi:predicted ester cyclase
MFYAAFTGLHHVIEETVADQEKVAVRFTLHGTHTGDFM